MTDTIQSRSLRVAFRHEGMWWRAYFAKGDTMEGAMLLGEMLAGPAERDPVIKEAFMDLMRAIVARGLVDIGVDVERWCPPMRARDTQH